MDRVRVAAAVFAATSVACSGTTPGPQAESRYLTVFVAKDGAMEVDGREASLSELEAALEEAKAAGAVVLFAREAPERDRAPIARMVLQMVRERKVPVRMCRNRDFSDAIGPLTPPRAASPSTPRSAAPAP